MVSPALSRRLRWSAPVVALGVVAAGVTVPRLADAADASAALPPRTAEQLLAAVSTAEVEGLSGTVVATSRLGLPELPSSGGGSAVSLTDLLSGSTTARVWKAGDDRSRIAVDASWAEYDVVRDGRDVWTYDSASEDVTHLVLPDGSPEPAAPAPGTAATPEQVADALLAAVEPTTTVTVGRAEEVAGRAAYELVLEPRDDRTLIDTVRIAVDGETSVPLRVRVYGDGQPQPAAEVTFTEIDLEVPDAQALAFRPPAGSTVTERSLDDLAQSRPSPSDRTAPTGPAPTVLGTGWSTVVEMRGVELPDDGSGLLASLSEPAEGGRAISSALLSALLLDDGRVLVGAVPVDRLEELAQR
jgi:outer membrane lipoprotein-sorting protein